MVLGLLLSSNAYGEVLTWNCGKSETLKWINWQLDLEKKQLTSQWQNNKNKIDGQFARVISVGDGFVIVQDYIKSKSDWNSISWEFNYKSGAVFTVYKNNKYYYGDCKSASTIVEKPKKKEPKQSPEEEKRIAEAGEDLNGKKLYCKGSNILDFAEFDIEEYAAIVFNKNHRATLSWAFVMADYVGDYTSKKIFKYEVKENVIIIRSEADPQIKLDTRLDRESLKLYRGFVEPSYIPKCKIVNYNPLEKFEKEIKKFEAKKKKKKKI